MADVRLSIDGMDYEAWKAVSISRSIESLAGSFSLGVSDHWVDQALTWPIREQDDCSVKIDGQTVIDGWVNRRSPSFTSATRELVYQGYDASYSLAKCAAVLDHWTFRKKTVLQIVDKLAQPFGIGVSVQPGLEGIQAPDKVTVSPGDTAAAVIAKVAKAAGVMVVSDGRGGIVITRAGTARASQDLIEGERGIKAGGFIGDMSERFSRYLVMCQSPGSDNSNGAATQIRGEATDAGVRRTDHVTIIHPESGLTLPQARAYADWAARVRAARAASVSITVHGWKQSDGSLWPLNVLIYVKSKTLDVDADMLISQANHSKNRDGEVTVLRLVRPDAFTPSPLATVREL